MAGMVEAAREGKKWYGPSTFSRPCHDAHIIMLPSTEELVDMGKPEKEPSEEMAEAVNPSEKQD